MQLNKTSRYLKCTKSDTPVGKKTPSKAYLSCGAFHDLSERRVSAPWTALYGSLLGFQDHGELHSTHSVIQLFWLNIFMFFFFAFLYHFFYQIFYFYFLSREEIDWLCWFSDSWQKTGCVEKDSDMFKESADLLIGNCKISLRLISNRWPQPSFFVLWVSTSFLLLRFALVPLSHTYLLAPARLSPSKLYMLVKYANKQQWRKLETKE